jgi:CRISPR/Cas system-associated exonuclease Cas4 (RecB family)
MVYFLNQVANWIFENKRSELKNIQLVFPNRRSGLFFLHYFKQIVIDSGLNNPVWLPKVTPINEFVSGFTDLRLSEPIELLGKLFIIYKEESKSAESFDNFYNWGEMMLADFSDVDKYLVNPEAVFGNVRDLKKMESDFQFLSKEQIEVIRRFFSNFDATQNTELKDRFIKMWEVLLPVYLRLQKHLLQNKIGYEGLVYKQALESVKMSDAFEFEKVYFIGFNAITPVEEKIFEYLQGQNKAGFFWDYDAYYVDNMQMEAGYFQRKYIRKFPSEPGFVLNHQLIDKTRKINAVSVSTDHGQVFKASQILNAIPVTELHDTALVLSDEQLLMPVLNQIPANVEEVNVTMGYGIRESMMAQWIDLLINLHSNAKLNEDGILSFYYKNVVDILNHPFMHRMVNQEADALILQIKSENLYQLKQSQIPDKIAFKKLFVHVDTIIAFENYVKELILFLNENLWCHFEPGSKIELEKEFAYHIYLKINQLSEQIGRQNISIQLPTYFKLLRKIIKNLRIPFEGEPIGGLQLMGFLETRNLDFKNLIILSVNEGVLPASANASSFIPYSLRKGFGLPTRDLHDAMFAYYFYRLLQRAQNVWLVYNSGSSGLASGEKSRFIYQLQYDSNFHVHIENVVQSIDVIAENRIVIEKRGEVLTHLLRYLEPDKKLFLSPSALSTYLSCSLRYYFKAIAKIHEPDKVEEQIDARLFGSIFHVVAEKFYMPFLMSKKELTSLDLNTLLNDNVQLDAWILEAFQSVLRGPNSKKVFEIEGKNHIVFQVIKKYLQKMIAIDSQNTPFEVLGLEQDVFMDIPIVRSNSKANVRVGGQIDRLDRVKNALRVVDYKSGADKLSFNSIDDVFDAEKIQDVKAVFQTFVYSLAVAKNYPSEIKIVPTVYQLKNFFAEDVDFSVTSKDPMYATGNFKDVEALVSEKLTWVLEDLFNEHIPFKQTNDLKRCGYCPYKQICGR